LLDWPSSLEKAFEVSSPFVSQKHPTNSTYSAC
jgi:hypothetical protein